MSRETGHHWTARLKGNLIGNLFIVHFHIRTTVIFYKADLSIVVSNQVLQREEPPGVRPHWDFTGQCQRFCGRLQQGHLVPVCQIKEQGKHKMTSNTRGKNTFTFPLPAVIQGILQGTLIRAYRPKHSSVPTCWFVSLCTGTNPSYLNLLDNHNGHFLNCQMWTTYRWRRIERVELVKANKWNVHPGSFLNHVFLVILDIQRHT